MPWLVLILVMVWLLGKSGILGKKHRASPPTASPSPEAAREAASAWSTYVPAEDEPRPVPDPAPATPSTPVSPWDDEVWEQASWSESFSDDQAAAEAHDEGETPAQADGKPRDPYDDVPDRASGEIVDSEARPERAIPDDGGSPQPGSGAIIDPADEPRPVSEQSPNDDH